MNNKDILINNISNNKGSLFVTKQVINYDCIIFDFYNLYCNLIDFNKHRHFTKESVKLCIEKIINSTGDNQVILVSKDIFEISIDEIQQIIKDHPRITYVIVQDLPMNKSKNRERDDFICILFSYLKFRNSNKKPLLVTNDKFKNFNKTVAECKPTILICLNTKLIREIPINTIFLNTIREKLYKFKMERSNFLYN